MSEGIGGPGQEAPRPMGDALAQAEAIVNNATPDVLTQTQDIIDNATPSPLAQAAEVVNNAAPRALEEASVPPVEQQVQQAAREALPDIAQGIGEDTSAQREALAQSTTGTSEKRFGTAADADRTAATEAARRDIQTAINNQGTRGSRFGRLTGTIKRSTQENATEQPDTENPPTV